MSETPTKRALRDLLKAFDVMEPYCEFLSHGKADLHKIGFACPVEARVSAAVNAARRELARKEAT